MHGGPVPVVVGSVEVKIAETLQMREGFIDEQSGDVGAGLLAECETTWAFERLKKVAALGTLRPLHPDFLEEGTAAVRIMQRAHHAQL